MSGSNIKRTEAMSRSKAAIGVAGGLVGVTFAGIGIKNGLSALDIDTTKSLISTGQVLIGTGITGAVLNEVVSGDVPRLHRPALRGVAAGTIIVGALFWNAAEPNKPVNNVGSEVLKGAETSIAVDESLIPTTVASTIPLCEITLPIATNDVTGVKKLQAALSETGYDLGPIDGTEGPLTEAAISRFRQDFGFSGVFNEMMCQALPSLIDGNLGTPIIP